MATTRTDTDLLRQRAVGYRKWGDELAAYPSNYDEIHDNIYRQGAIMHAVATASSEAFERQRAAYNRCAAHRHGIASALTRAADVFEAAEQNHAADQRGVGGE